MADKIKIVIIGNGFGGIYTLKQLQKIYKHKKDIEITLIGEKNYFLFTPLLHEVATGSINKENILEPIRKIMDNNLSNFLLGRVEKINTKEKTVVVGEAMVPYDYLIISSGSKTDFHNTPNAEKYSLTLKSIEDAIKIKNQIIKKVENASSTKNIKEKNKKLSFVVVGGGPTGVELATEIQEFIIENLLPYYKKDLIENVSINLIQKNSELLPQFNKKIRQKSLEILTKKGVKIFLDNKVKEINDSFVLLENDVKIETETIIWVAGVKPEEIKFDQQVEKSKDQRLLVNEYLQLKGHREIFSIGDNTAFDNKESFLPPLAQVAEQEAKMVAKNIYSSIKNKNLEKFKYRHRGKMISLGKWMAMGEIYGFILGGHFAWFMWRTIYLLKLISLRKKIRVAFDWTINIFFDRDIAES